MSKQLQLELEEMKVEQYAYAIYLLSKLNGISTIRKNISNFSHLTEGMGLGLGPNGG